MVKQEYQGSIPALSKCLPYLSDPLGSQRPLIVKDHELDVAVSGTTKTRSKVVNDPLALAGRVPPHAVEREAGNVAVDRFVLSRQSPKFNSERFVLIQEPERYKDLVFTLPSLSSALF